MSLYTFLWLAWIAAFFAIELPALILHKDEGDTLSEHIWAWASIKNKGKAWRIRRFSLLAFLAWLSFHFLSGGNW